VAEYAISTNLISWVPAKRGLFGWPQDGPEAEVVESMRPGDLLIPKFAQTPAYHRGGGDQIDYVKGICAVLGLDYDEEVRDYEDQIAAGAGAVPFIWRVQNLLPPDRRFPNNVPWSVVEIIPGRFADPYSTSEFLRLRAIPIEIARQFKATAAQGRHIQKLPDGTVEQIARFGDAPRDDNALRNLLLVKAASGGQAVSKLHRAGVEPRPGDYLFLVQDSWMPGFFRLTGKNGLDAEPQGVEVAQSADELVDLVERAVQRATPGDGLRPANIARAARQLSEFVESDRQVEAVAEFSHFYDRFVNLPQKVSQALEIADREAPTVVSAPRLEDEGAIEDEDEDSEQLEEDSLRGLTASSVQANLDGIVLPSTVLAEAVTALRAGKHILLSGPPGTGKSVVAAALCRAVVDEEFQTATATADWTTFDTIGGYMPQDGGALEFEPGIVLRSLERGRWLVIDELNRADIDKAFGPLFTLLSSSAEAGGGEAVTLPFRKAEKNIRIVRAVRRADASSPYALTPTWRMIGTLNVRDKATLFQLSFAFLRRFAVVDVPLPDESAYRELFEGWVQNVDPGVRGELADAAMKLAFAKRQLGPAILKDIASFVRMGLAATDTTSGSSAYGDAVEAFLTAVRLYAVPQYEGAEKSEIDALLQALRGVWSEPPKRAWGALEGSLDDVGLS
jgi:MoxR-like ATPase